MLFRRNKITETKRKPGMYGNMQTSNYSSWDNMSLIEKFCMVFLPVMLGFMVWTMCDAIIPDLKWFYRLPISVGVVAGVIGLITLIVNFFHTEY